MIRPFRLIIAAVGAMIIAAAAAPGATGEQTGSKTVNGTGCECLSRACCLCVDETMDNALQVQLSHSGELKAGCTFKVWLIACAPAPGPRFDGPTGPQSKPIDCDGKWHCFTVWGGKKPGHYKVCVESTCPDLPSACTDCGSICVFPTDQRVLYGGDIGTLFGPAAPPPKLTPPGFSYVRAICGTHPDPTPLPANNHFATFVYQAPNPDAPPPTITRRIMVNIGDAVDAAGKNHLLGTISDDCGDRLECYCMPVGGSSQFRLYYVDCHGQTYHIASCEWDNATNDAKIEDALCEKERKFSRISWRNINTKNGRVNSFVFDACTHTLDAQCIGNAANKQIQFSNGANDDRFAPNTLKPRQPTTSPRDKPLDPFMPPCQN